MKIVAIAAAAAGLFVLAACGTETPAENQAENFEEAVENQVDVLEEQADNATDPAVEQQLENRAEAVEETVEPPPVQPVENANTVGM